MAAMYSIEEAIRRLELLKGTGVEYRPVGAGRAGPRNSLDSAAPGGMEPAGEKPAPVAPVPSRAGADMPDGIRDRRVDLILDLQGLSQRGFLMPDTPRAEVAEQFRVLKRPLLSSIEQGLARGGRPAHPIAGTTPQPPEGNTNF
jgi:hypothetical protein